VSKLCQNYNRFLKPFTGGSHGPQYSRSLSRGGLESANWPVTFLWRVLSSRIPAHQTANKKTRTCCHVTQLICSTTGLQVPDNLHKLQVTHLWVEYISPLDISPGHTPPGHFPPFIWCSTFPPTTTTMRQCIKRSTATKKGHMKISRRNEHLYSPRMVEEIKEEKNGTSNKQTVIWPNYLNYLNYSV